MQLLVGWLHTISGAHKILVLPSFKFSSLEYISQFG
jgi:hypothetical protein